MANGHFSVVAQFSIRRRRGTECRLSYPWIMMVIGARLIPYNGRFVCGCMYDISAFAASSRRRMRAYRKCVRHNNNNSIGAHRMSAAMQNNRVRCNWFGLWWVSPSPIHFLTSSYWRWTGKSGNAFELLGLRKQKQASPTNCCLALYAARNAYQSNRWNVTRLHFGQAKWIFAQPNAKHSIILWFAPRLLPRILYRSNQRRGEAGPAA